MKIIKMTMSSHSMILGLSMIAALCICVTTAAPLDPPGTSPFLLLSSSKFACGPKDLVYIVKPRILDAASSYIDEYETIVRRSLNIYVNAMYKSLGIPLIPEERIKFDWDKFDQHEPYMKRKYAIVSALEFDFEEEVDDVISSARRDFTHVSEKFTKDMSDNRDGNLAFLSIDDIADALDPTRIEFENRLLEVITGISSHNWIVWYKDAAWTDFQHEHGSDLTNVDKFKTHVRHNDVEYNRDTVVSLLEDKFSDAIQDMRKEVKQFLSLSSGSSILTQKLIDKFARKAQYKSIPLIVD